MSDVSLEKEMQDLGTSRYHKRLAQARNNRNESSVPAVRYLMRNAIVKLEAALEEWLAERGKIADTARTQQAAYPYLSIIPVDVASFIACRTLFDRISATNIYTGTALAIGSALQDELHYGTLKDAHVTLFDRMVSRLRKNTTRARRRNKMVKTCKEVLAEGYQDWGIKNRCKVGVVLIELLIESTGLVEVIREQFWSAGHVKERNILRPTEETLRWLEQSHERHSLMTPFYMPTKVKPVAWTAQDDGGYASDQVYRRNLTKSTARGQSFLDATAMPQVYSAINTLQETAWVINEDVYQIMTHLRTEGGGVAGLPLMSDAPMPPAPDNMQDDQVRKAYGKACAVVRGRNTQARSARLSLAKLLLVAEKVRGSKFWFPQQLDFRGRCYPLPFFLQPQGHDTARSLLLFADGKPLHDPEALMWHRIHGANCWGEDKSRFSVRLAWVQENLDKILAVGAEPLENMWWTKAEKPWQFLAWCIEVLAYTEDPEGFRSRIPVAMDGTNNGLQVYSLLLRDPVGGKATNVLPSDEPQDIYRDVADVVTAKLRALATRTGIAEDAWKTQVADEFLVWVGGQVPRECTKRSVMTLPYGSTAYANRRYVTEWYEEAAEARNSWLWPQHDHFKQTAVIADIVWESIGEVVVAAQEAMRWLRTVAGIASKAGCALHWTSPVGFPVYQDYRKHFSAQISTSIGDRVRVNRLHLPTELRDSKRQRQGFPPNYVHSLDAAALMATVNLARSRGIRQFAMVHDSYGVLAADAPLMARTLREAYVDLFKAPLLEELRSEIQAMLPPDVILPPVPPSGDLPLEALLTSPYFFA